ncbi:MAG: beta-lactamase family protein [Anaerolineales bacterium]|nr:beta-lactamase family protein [Anaerolineales bacterium]
MSEKNQDVWDQLPTFFENTLTSLGVPGGVVGILYEGETRVCTFGVTNVNHPLPITEDTLFQIGSISKTYTATAIMRLVEMGKMDLDEKVRTYLSDFRVKDDGASENVTVRQLLCHTAGWGGDYFIDTGSGDDALERFVQAMARFEQVSPTGLHFAYNNTAFQLAGRIIEVVTGKTYEAAIQELIFQLLGLEQSFFNPSDVMVHRFVVGHSATPKGAVVAEPWPLSRNANPAGGVICTVLDLLRYGRFHMGNGQIEDGSRLLGEDSIALMQTPQAAIWKEEALGLSWFLETHDGVRTISHGGTTIGQQAELTLVPERNFAVAVLTNADVGLAANDTMKNWALREFLGLDIQKPQEIEASEADLAEYAGRYSNPIGAVEMGLLCGRLVAQMIYTIGYPNIDDPPPPPPAPFSFGLCEKDRLLGLDGRLAGYPAEILRSPDGDIAYLRFGHRLYKRQD